jgi:3-hydroxyacyl-CoA dehydrogenase
MPLNRRAWLACALATVALPRAMAAAELSLNFRGTPYLHRWSSRGQHEFTPAPDADLARWRFEADPVAAVQGCDLIQESAPERYEVKQPLLRAISAALPADVLIASSSSGLLVSRLSEGCRHPGRVVIGHPFNPPHLIPLVEVVGPQATRAAIEAAMAFYRQLGKHPIEIRKEVPGHLANRLQAALWREAVHLLAEDVASVADIDAAISEGPGLRWALMGPHATLHLAGGEGGMEHFLHHLLPALESWWSTRIPAPAEGGGGNAPSRPRLPRGGRSRAGP